jgi:hypothetical protein
MRWTYRFPAGDFVIINAPLVVTAPLGYLATLNSFRIRGASDRAPKLFLHAAGKPTIPERQIGARGCFFGRNLSARPKCPQDVNNPSFAFHKLIRLY